jgi:16S rRNA C1402 (ribose-2'-O) methylase RsmI
MLNSHSGPLTLQARGHRNIRATHDKTIELTSDDDFSARATCVVGTIPATALTPLTGLRGSVTITLRVGHLEERITGIANPRFVGGSRAVIRRSDFRSPETLITGADKAAAALDRDLVRALADPETRIDVVIELGADPPQRTAELLVCPWRVVAGLAAYADSPPRDASPAGTWAAALRSTALLVGVGPGVEPARQLGQQTGQQVEAGAAGLALVEPALRRGEAVALVCETTQAPGAVARLVGEAVEAGWTVSAVGASATTAMLVAGGLVGAPSAHNGLPPSGAVERRRQIAALARASVVGVWTGRVDALLDLLTNVAADWAQAQSVLSLNPNQPNERHLRGTAEALVTQAGDLSGTRNAALAVDLRRDAAVPTLDLEVRLLLAALLDEDVPPSTLARALQRMPGMTRREGYDLVLALRQQRSKTHDIVPPAADGK